MGVLPTLGGVSVCFSPFRFRWEHFRAISGETKQFPEYNTPRNPCANTSNRLNTKSLQTRLRPRSKASVLPLALLCFIVANGESDGATACVLSAVCVCVGRMMDAPARNSARDTLMIGSQQQRWGGNASYVVTILLASGLHSFQKCQQYRCEQA